jgi:RNA recognition motif-containing protein
VAAPNPYPVSLHQPPPPPFTISANASAATPLPSVFTNPNPPQQAPGFDCRIYVGSLNYDLKEVDINALFASFGTIKTFSMSYDNLTGKSKGYCFIEYETAAMAEAALVSLE